MMGYAILVLEVGGGPRHVRESRMNNAQKYNAIMEAGHNGQFFSVRFIKRSTGLPRYMNCRRGVTKHLKGGTKGYDDTVHQLVTVYDVQAEGYRSIPLESIFEINGNPVE